MEGKVAVVTGASRGIGRAVCQGLAEAGARVVAASRSEVDAPSGTQFESYASGTIHQTVESIRGAGGEAIAVKCDVSRSGDVRLLVETTLDQYGRIDVVVSNAGIDCEAPVVDLDIDLFDRCLAVNVRAPLLLCKFALPSMIAQNSGAIVGITSGSARGYRECRVGYSMSKAALERMFLSLAEEVRPHNIAVNLLSPGRVDTWMNRNGDWPGTAHIPMVAPSLVIPAAAWLAAQSAETFTGQVVERADFGVTWGTNARTRPDPGYSVNRPRPFHTGKPIPSVRSRPVSFPFPDPLPTPKHQGGMLMTTPNPALEVAPKMAELSANVLFGDVWERPELSKRDRSLITVATLVALYRTDQLRGHINRALDNGVTKEEIGEVITHMAFYAGWPTAANAVRVAKEVFDSR